MLIIFDVDGTLVGGEAHDWTSFDCAIASVLGCALPAGFIAALPEITAQAIAEEAIGASAHSPSAEMVERICEEYLRRLRDVHTGDPQAFPAREGVHALFAHLATIPEVKVAIATGDWHSTISFKLSAAGLDVSGYPVATASDARSRAEIIKLAIERAGGTLADAVYVGDGVWDLRACRALGIPFIGTGSRVQHLRDAGAEHVVEVLEIQPFVDAVRSALRRDKMPVHAH